MTTITEDVLQSSGLSCYSAAAEMVMASSVAKVVETTVVSGLLSCSSAVADVATTTAADVATSANSYF